MPYQVTFESSHKGAKGTSDSETWKKSIASCQDTGCLVCSRDNRRPVRPEQTEQGARGEDEVCARGKRSQII